MINVSGGHEKGIGLEVFLKSFLLLNRKEQRNIHLFCSKDALLESANSCSIPITENKNVITICGDQLKVTFIDKHPLSTTALEEAIKCTSSTDILLTLPTSKDQLVLNGRSPAGHTEYFREFYKTDITMFFKSHQANVLLVTDHIPLSEAHLISSEDIHKAVTTCVDNYEKYFNKIKNIFISGINPHCGEGGILGSEDKVINHAIENLAKRYTKNIVGPIASDSMLIGNSFKNESLFVYQYHDQGLAPFKSLFKTVGANISLGLPFLRLSVDHGTAFDLYGKNCADYRGCAYVLNLALKVNKRLNHD